MIHPLPSAVTSAAAAIDQEVDQHQRDALKWRSDTLGAIDRMALDWDGFAADHDVSFLQRAPDPDRAKRQAVVGAYLRLAYDGRPPKVAPEIARDQIARHHFGGKGVGDDDAFFEQIRGEAQHRADQNAARNSIASAASRWSLMAAAKDARAAESNLSAWREANAGNLAGLTDKEVLETWSSQADSVDAVTAPFQPELASVWQGFQSGQATFWETFDQVEEPERDRFIEAVGMLARALPEDEQRGFLASLGEQAGRDVERMAESAGVGMTIHGLRSLDPYGPTVDAPERQRLAGLLRERMDFVADIRRIAHQEFDPVTADPNHWLPEWAQRAAFQTPGIGMSTVTALVPYVGPVASFEVIREDSRQTMRADLMANGMSREEASRAAEALSPIAAIPAAALERIGARGMFGRIPTVNRVLTNAADRFGKQAATRYATRTIAGAIGETATEAAQDLLTPLVQELAAALDEDLPGPTWSNGETGYLDGYWAQNGETFLAVLPLALLGAGVGVGRDRRNSRLAQATDTELLALGFSSDRIREIREAEGYDSLGQAIDVAIRERDPNSEEARDAVQDIAEEAQAQREALEHAQDLGLVPRFERTPAGWNIVDQTTGNTIGTAATKEEALELGQQHSDDLARAQVQEIDILLDLMEAADTVAADNTDTEQTTTEIRPAEYLTATQAAAESQQDEARVQAQVEAAEALGQETGMSQIVLGRSSTEFRQDVRETVNRIQRGASVLTVFHEDVHGKFRRALQSGRLTTDETVTFLRALDQVLADTAEKGRSARLLPDVADADLTATQIDEAVSEFMEAEILRTRKGGRGGRKLPSGTISRNLSAVARIAGNVVTKKFADFIRAMRARFGMILRRSIALRRGIASGEIDAAQYDAFLDKLLGLEEQTEFDGQATATAREIIDDADPFSLAPVTQTQDAEYMAAVEAGDMETAQRMVDDAAAAAGYHTRALHGTAEKFDRFDHKHGGRMTEALSARSAFFFTDDERTANSYAVYAAEDGPIKAALAKANTAERRGDWDGYDSSLIEAEQLDTSEGRLQRRANARLLDVYLAGEFLEFDAEGKTPQELHDGDIDAGISAEIRRAKREGMTGVAFRNLDDAINVSNRPANHYAVFRPSQIKSAEPVTRDAAGNVVPLSQRFNPSDDRIAYSLGVAGLNKIFQSDPQPHTVTPTDALPERIQEIAQTHGVAVVDSDRLARVAQEIERAYGLRPVFYVGHPTTLGFSPEGNRELIYINAEPQDGRPLAWATAHELFHAAQQTPGSGALELGEQFRSLITDDELADSKAALLASGEYTEDTWERELSAYIIGDAVAGTDHFGLSTFSQSEAIREAAIAGFDQIGHLTPESLPNVSDSALSLAPSEVATLVQADAAARVRDPERRSKMLRRMAEKLEQVRTRAEEIELATGTPRLAKSLRKEAAIRQAFRADELENQALAQHSQVLAAPELAQLSTWPLHSLFAGTKSDGSPDHLHGRIESPSAYKKRTGAKSPSSEYDGSEDVGKTVFGGRLSPDQAAQEAHESGMIAEPTTDALWSALAAEERSAAVAKTALDRANADLAAARKTSREETREWLDKQLKAQTSPVNIRQQVTQALATLDGLLMALPPEVRGKVGGYTALSRLGTGEARLKFLLKKLDTVDAELERWLKRELNRDFLRLLERTKPAKGKAGEKPKGKAGADVHDLFAHVRRFMGESGPEVEAEAQRLETLAADPDTPAVQAAHYALTAHMVRLAGNWRNADADRRQAALAEGWDIYSAGYARAKAIEELKRENRRRRRETATLETGKNGSPLARDFQETKDATKRGKVRAALLNLYSFEQAANAIFGHESSTAEWLRSSELEAYNAKADAIQHKLDSLEGLLESLAGGKFKGEQLRHELGKPGTVKAGGGSTSATERSMSQLMAIQATLLWQQEDGRRHMLGKLDDAGNPAGPWHYNQAFIDQVENQLTNEAKAVRQHIRAQYSAEYDRLNAVYRQLYGINLPQHANYAPITVAPIQSKTGPQPDPVTGMPSTGIGMTPGSLRSRSTTAVAEPDFRDALQTYIGHTMQMEHWMAYAPFVTEAQAVLGDRELGNAITEKAGQQGKQILRDWIALFSEGGNRDAANYLTITQLMNRGIGTLAGSALIGRLSVLAVQSTQAFAALAEMPAGAFAIRFAKLITGQLSYRQALKSDLIRRRMNDMPPAVQAAMQGLNAGKPRRVVSAMRWLGRSIAGADALFSAATYAITYDYHLSNAPAGLTDRERADYATGAATRSTERVAQPTRAATRSILENRATHPAARLLWAFSSEARQKLSLSFYAMAEKRSAREIVRAGVVTWLVGGLFSGIIRAAVRDLRDDQDEEWFDERNWDPKRLALATIAGPLYGIPYLGEEIEAGLNKAFGIWSPQGTLLSNLADLPKGAWDLGEALIGADPEADLESILKDLESVFEGGATFSRTSSAASNILHMIRDAIGIAENIEGPDK